MEASTGFTSLGSNLIIQIRNTRGNNRSTFFRITYKGTQKYMCKDVHWSIVWGKLERTQMSWLNKLRRCHTTDHSAAVKTQWARCDCAWHIVGTQARRAVQGKKSKLYDCSMTPLCFFIRVSVFAHIPQKSRRTNAKLSRQFAWKRWEKRISSSDTAVIAWGCSEPLDHCSQQEDTF